MIKACIFDLDGTLTNTLDSLEYSVNETRKKSECHRSQRNSAGSSLEMGRRFCLNGH